MLRRNATEMRDGLVYKLGDSTLLEMEALRMNLAAELGKSSGQFCVPKLVRLDLPNRTLVSEFVPELRNLYELAEQQDPETEEIFAQAGRALATVHRELHLPADKLRTFPAYLLSAPEDNVAVHGDFCWGNVCWRARERQIVLLDWETTPVLGGVANYGSRYFDLLWFSWSLFFWTPPRQLLQWRPERLMRVLVRGYTEAERSFRWQEYIRLRSSMRPLLLRYWRRKQRYIPARLHINCVHWLGWLRWLLFPAPYRDESINRTKHAKPT